DRHPPPLLTGRSGCPAATAAPPEAPAKIAAGQPLLRRRRPRRGLRRPASEVDDGADALAFVHQIERAVDVLERHRVRDELVDLDLAVEILIDHARQLAAPLHAAERAAPPDAAGDELERPRADLLPGGRDADDRRLAPALVAALERGAHQLHVADRLEGIVDAAVRHVDDHLLDRLVVVFRVHEVRRAELAGELLLVRVDVDRDDAARLSHRRALDHAQADAAQAEHRDRRARAHLGGGEHGADAGRDPAAEQADLLERRLLADLRDRDLRQHRVLGERRRAHEVQDALAVLREAARAVGHQTLALRHADFLAEIRPAGLAELAL